jgi:hypothetical protein
MCTGAVYPIHVWLQRRYIIAQVEKFVVVKMPVQLYTRWLSSYELNY